MRTFLKAYEQNERTVATKLSFTFNTPRVPDEGLSILELLARIWGKNILIHQGR